MNAKYLTILIAVGSAVLTFLLTQPDVILPPVAKVVIGALSVALTVAARLSQPAP